MQTVTELVDSALERGAGILKLRANFVSRYYRDGGRLNLRRRYRRDVNRWYAERWIASTVLAHNPHPIPGEGLSVLDIGRSHVTLKAALEARGEKILGSQFFHQFGAHFPVLSKIFDCFDPIIFHFHPRDEDVRRYPRHFHGEKWGKEEAYFFPRAPKGRMPYTHVGLRSGVDLNELGRAVDGLGDDALELSPVFAQRVGEGFHVPAGVPHRPGTALTVEIQQPSDVVAHLDWISNGKRLSPEQMHPGFQNVRESLRFIDWRTSQAAGLLEANRLLPELIAGTRQPRHGEEYWIFPPRMTTKFSGKRVVVTGAFETVEEQPYALLFTAGNGELNGVSVSTGDEFLVSLPAARVPQRLRRTGSEPLEAFKFFPPRLQR